MLGGMTAAQFAEWQEFARVEPFGFGVQADFVSLLCAVVANSAAFRSGPAVQPSAFRLRPDRDDEDREAAEPDTRDALGAGAVAVGPDLSRPLPD